MLYIKSIKNKSYIAIKNNNVNIFAGKKYVDRKTDEYFISLNITTELGTTEIIGYHESVIATAVDKLFAYIINYDFSDKTNTVIEITDICGSEYIFDPRY